MASRIELDQTTDVPAPLGGTRGEAIQRMQVGLSLLGGVILLVGLANVIEDRAKLTDAARVPDAAATVGASPSAAAQNDPLADAGVVPDLPAEPVPSPVNAPPILPEQGNAAPSQ